MDWFLCDMDLRRERVKVIQTNQINFGESDRLHLRINSTGKQTLGAGASYRKPQNVGACYSKVTRKSRKTKEQEKHHSSRNGVFIMNYNHNSMMRYQLPGQAL